MVQYIVLLLLFFMHAGYALSELEHTNIISFLQPCQSDDLEIVKVPVETVIHWKLIPTQQKHTVSQLVAHLSKSDSEIYYTIATPQEAHQIAQQAAQHGERLDWYYLDDEARAEAELAND